MFVYCNTSNIIVAQMGTMISNSIGTLVGQHRKWVGCAHQMTIPAPLFFKYCALLQLQGVLGFLDDPVVQSGGQFLTNEQLLRKKFVADLHVVKVAPPSMPCKRL